MQIELNPQLDIKALKKELGEHQRLRIENFFTPESAEYIAHELQHNTAWHLVHSDAKGFPVRYDDAATAALTEQQREDMLHQLHARATSSYQYIYRFFPVIDAIKSGQLQPHSMLYQFASFVNGTQFIGLARELTSTATLVKTDPQATLYDPGHFLTTHDDSNYQRSANDSSTRRFAIVFGFTRDWPLDWGGQTSFFDSLQSRRSESWYPGFNALSIFRVPALHCVNPVAPFAARGRYSITGWLRDDPTVKRPDLGDR